MVNTSNPILGFREMEKFPMKRYGLILETGIVEAQKVINVALGREKADLAIVDGTVLNLSLIHI